MLKEGQKGDALIPDSSKEKEKLTARVLIVDDQAVYRKSLEMVLRFKPETDGFSLIIDEADNLQDALKQIAENNYEVVITDGVFPEEAGGYVGDNRPEDFRGNQVIQAAKSKGVKLVVGMSAEPQGFKGADLIFEKPIDIESLRQAVKEAIEEEINK